MNPLVSCVMPIKDRRKYFPAALDCWLKQDYENRELIIVDDSEYVCNEIPSDDRIRSIIEKPFATLGEKRNYCNGLARGEIICQFDSDDWSAPNRISTQVALLESSGKPVTGYSQMLYWDGSKAMLYKSTVPGYVVGLSLCYLKSWWEQNQFPAKQSASDNDVIYKNLRNIAASPELGMIVARAHGENVGGVKRFPAVSKDMIPAGFWGNEKLRLE